MTVTRDIRRQSYGALSIILSFLFVLCFAGISFAAEKAMHVTGQVTAVDTAAKTLTVKGTSGEVALMVGDTTKFGKGKSLADLKVGDTVTVRYVEKDGKMMASSVKAGKASTKKKKEMMEEKKGY